MLAFASSSSSFMRCRNSSSTCSLNSSKLRILQCQCRSSRRRSSLWLRQQRSCFKSGATGAGGAGVPHPPLDLTEDNIRQVLAEARLEVNHFEAPLYYFVFVVQLGQLFDGSVGITGEVELADLDGPYVKISLKGRFWHKRSTVVARLGNYLQQRIPEILEVDIEDEKQLDDSPANF
ncbi:hypothetical protein LINGRAHAP2_LOCUS10971 [Linum grandiflorum]